MREWEKEKDKERASQRKRAENTIHTEFRHWTLGQRNATAVSGGQRALVSLRKILSLSCLVFFFFFTHGPNAVFNMLTLPHNWWRTSKGERTKRKWHERPRDIRSDWSQNESFFPSQTMTFFLHQNVLSIWETSTPKHKLSAAGFLMFEGGGNSDRYTDLIWSEAVQNS